MTFAVLFPGQGSQSVGMLADLAESHAPVKTTFDEAAEILKRDFWELSRQGPEAVLADTEVTQPLMFTAGVAVWRSLRSAGLPMPDAVAGHSLGEFAALVAADSLAFADGLMLVQQRAKLMARAVPAGEGGMAALIGMQDEDVEKLCQSLSGERVVEAVNFNAPGQVAISGHVDALERAIEKAKSLGCRKAMILAVSVPNHSSLMRQAGEELAETIDSMTFKEPQIPLLQNATASAADSLQSMLDCLKSHVYSPVQWTRTIARMRDDFGVTSLIEAGPGRVLTGLTKRIDRALPTVPVESSETLQKAIAATAAADQETRST